MSTKSPGLPRELATENVVEHRVIDSLKQNPLQDKFFSDLSSFDLGQLKRSLRQNGLKYPLEILSDGTILDGHQRLRAAQQLGWKSVPCLVCRDLEAQGELACKQRFFEANLHRRQLTPLQTVRCYRELYGDLKRQRSKQGILRDQLAEKFNMSGRHFDRLAKVLDAPVEIQRLCEAGQLKVELASRVAQLPQARQRKLVAELSRLSEGAKPNEVVKRALVMSANRSQAGEAHRSRVVTTPCQLMDRVNWIVKNFKPRVSDRGVSSSCVRPKAVREAIKVLQSVLDHSND